MKKVKILLLTSVLLVSSVPTTAFANSLDDLTSKNSIENNSLTISPRAKKYTFTFVGSNKTITISDSSYVGSNVTRGDTVRAVQILLCVSGLGEYLDKIDGVYGSQTKEAIMAFQQNYGLSADGIVGPDTWAAFYNYCSNDGEVNAGWS